VTGGDGFTKNSSNIESSPNHVVGVWVCDHPGRQLGFCSPVRKTSGGAPRPFDYELDRSSELESNFSRRQISSRRSRVQASGQETWSSMLSAKT
jgi:hypothetical protein